MCESLADKASLCGGADEWTTLELNQYGIPALRMSDGPSGLRVQDNYGDHLGLGTSLQATLFPSPCMVACSWDCDLVEQLGDAFGRECRAAGVGMLLAPGVNIKRHPLGGRNFEYYSEDPCLGSALGAAFVQGLQNRGVGACVKHFAANNQEWKRLTINTVVDYRTLREIYLAAFEGIIRNARPAAVMAAYNRLNGTWCSENFWLLDTVLRGEWGFDGVVISDWGGLHHRVPALLAGLDLEMPGTGPWNRDQILAALAEPDSGDVHRALDRSFRRVAAMAGRFAAEAKKAEAKTQEGPGKGDSDCGDKDKGDLHRKNHDFARQVAARSMVLVKNSGVLPMAAGTRVLLAGQLGTCLPIQGAGSSRVMPGAVEFLEAELARAGMTVRMWATDAAVPPELLGGVDLVLVCAGFPDGHNTEGLDRKDMDLPEEQNRLVASCSGHGVPVVVAVFGGGPACLPWFEVVDACIVCHLPGESGAGALADVCAGVVNPCGRLAETWPLAAADSPSDPWFPGCDRRVVYGEGPFVGYRGYRRSAKKVRFAFGFGLSYRGLELSDLRQVSPGGWPLRIQIDAHCPGTGPWPGREVVQVYTSPPAQCTHRPDLELRGFAALALGDGESRTLEFELWPRDFAWWNDQAGAWQVDAGSCTVRMGTSSDNLPLCLALDLPGGLYAPDGTLLDLPVPVPAGSGYLEALHALEECQPGSDLGRPGRPFTMDSCLEDLSVTLFGRLLTCVLLEVAKKKAGVNTGHRDYAMLKASLTGMPVRNLALMSKGALSMNGAEAIMLACNGRWLAALRTMTGTAASGRNPVAKHSGESPEQNTHRGMLLNQDSMQDPEQDRG